MKIAIFNPYSILHAGGVLDVVEHQTRELKKRGHQVTIITPRPRLYSGDAPEGVVFVGVSTRVKAQSSSPDISTVVDAEDISGVFERNRFDVVHFHEPVVPFVGRQLIAACPYPTVATLHAALPETNIGKTLGAIKPYFRSVLQYVDVVTRVSPAAGGYLDDLLDDVDVLEVPNGVDLHDYSPSKNRKENTILFIGRLEKRKGPKYLIEAFILLLKIHPTTKLVIVGEGHDKEKLELMVKERGVADSVNFLGHVDSDKKLELLRSATFACYPSIYGESFGIVLLEALATGTPIVAGDNPGYCSVLKEKGLISLVNVKDTIEFERRLRLFIENPDLRVLLGKWGLKYVQRFDYAKVVDQYETVYKKAITQHKRAH